MVNKVKYFTKKELEELYPAEIHFESVLRDHTLRSAPRWLTEQIISIYNNTTGENLKYTHCNACIYNIYYKIGSLYFESKKYLQSLQNARRGLQDPELQQAPQPTSWVTSKQGAKGKVKTNEKQQRKRAQNT